MTNTNTIPEFYSVTVYTDDDKIHFDVKWDEVSDFLQEVKDHGDEYSVWKKVNGELIQVNL